MAESDETVYSNEHEGESSYSLDDTILRHISSQFGNEWPAFGTHLGFKVPEIDRLRQDHTHTEEQIFQILVRYRNTHPSEAYSAILEASYKCGRKDVALDLAKCMNAVNQQHASSSPSQSHDRSPTAESSRMEMEEERLREKEQVQHHCRKCLFLQENGQVKEKRRHRPRMQREERKKLQVIPSVAYNSLKLKIKKAFPASSDLEDLKDLTAKDHKQQYGIEADQLDKVKDIGEFFNCLEELDLFGEDNLYFMTFLAKELDKKAAVKAIKNFARGSKQLPLVYYKPKRRVNGQGKKRVEWRIKGDCRHANVTDVELFRKTLSRRLHIPLRHINVVGKGKGSIILVFQMPEIGATRVSEALARKDDWLEESQVLEVHTEGEECVMIQEEYTQDDQFTNNTEDMPVEETEVKIGVTDTDLNGSCIKKDLTIDKSSEKSCKEVSAVGSVIAFVSRWAHKVQEVPKKVSQVFPRMETGIFSLKVGDNDLPNQVTHAKVEVPEKNPRVFILYSEDHELHKNCIRKLAMFLQIICSCQIRLDMWSTTEICDKKAWLNAEIANADKVLMIFSKGTLCKWQSAMELKLLDRGMFGEFDDMFLAGYSFASKEFKIDPCLLSSKYVAAYFDYSQQEDVLPDIRHVARYEIPINLEQLYFRLHDVVQHSPRSSRRIPTLYPNSYIKTSSEGLALHHAIQEMKNLVKAEPDWYNNVYYEENDSDACCDSQSQGDPDPSFFRQSSEGDGDNDSVAFTECYAEISQAY